MRQSRHFGPRVSASGTATCGLIFMGEDFWVEIDYEITAEGVRTTFDEQGWSPEFEIDSIHLSLDNGKEKTPRFEATGKLFLVLIRNTRIEDAVYEDISRNW